ncbi:MAG TPA: RluA family pseudouridine synthase, partial [Thermoanaerobaculia bacterium]|nr:RluA family pseudouridine synthase [Thermoanaerobaculia bacterium]
MSTARTFRADRGDARERLDRVLQRHLADRPEITRARLQAWIGDGLVRINGIPAAKPSSRLALGDQVEIVLPPPPARRQVTAQEMPLSVLYEDEHLLALDKPAGLVVHPTPGHREGTLVNALHWLARDWGEGRRPGLVNRLDKGTSGVVLVAKTPAVHGALARVLRSPTAEKEYLAVVYGATPFAKGSIDLKILRDPEDRRRRTVSKTEGRDSLTLYERLAEGSGLSLLRCVLKTGRTHQIRVHLKSQGLPIVGDPLYGEPRWKGMMDEGLAALCRDLSRQALHAYRLKLDHPVTGATMEIVAP